MSVPKNISFSPSNRKGKKYRVEFDLRGKTYVRHFGALGYDQYFDRTPLRLYSHLNHLDAKRRHRYYLRHGTSKDPLKAKYWANKYLW